MELQCIMFKQKKKKMTILSSWTTVRSLWSIISTNHMTPLCDHPVIHSALTNKHAAWRERRTGLWEMEVVWIYTLKLWHSQLSSLVWKELRGKKKTGSTEQDM